MVSQYLVAEGFAISFNKNVLLDTKKPCMKQGFIVLNANYSASFTFFALRPFSPSTTSNVTTAPT